MARPRPKGSALATSKDRKSALDAISTLDPIGPQSLPSAAIESIRQSWEEGRPFKYALEQAEIETGLTHNLKQVRWLYDAFSADRMDRMIRTLRGNADQPSDSERCDYYVHELSSISQVLQNSGDLDRYFETLSHLQKFIKLKYQLALPAPTSNSLTVNLQGSTDPKQDLQSVLDTLANKLAAPTPISIPASTSENASDNEQQLTSREASDASASGS